MAAIPEVLLALSGHDSPIFDPRAHETFEIVSPSELALLEQTGRLARLHQDIRSQVSSILSKNFGFIARAVALRIQTVHLRAFQQSILDFESKILRRDPAIVGAYDIVPLASLVSHFSDWNQKFEWLWSIVSFIAPSAHPQVNQKNPSGPAVIDRLRSDLQTGYPDIEELAKDLTNVAERVWLKQLGCWLMLCDGQTVGDNDFFIQKLAQSASEQSELCVEHSLLPEFLTAPTAASILFIVKLSHQLRRESSTGSIATEQTMWNKTNQVRRLSLISSPISGTNLSKVISAIRSAFVSQAAHGVLPTYGIIEVLRLLREYFLVGNNDFTDTLIREADGYLRSRHLHLRGTDSRTSRDLIGLMMKENEISEVLTRTFISLGPSLNSKNAVDTGTDWAREHFHLGLPSQVTEDVKNEESAATIDLTDVKSVSADFNQFLLSTPTRLSLRLKSPMDIFLTASDVEIYSSIHMYLLSIRRAHLHLIDLWRQHPLRKMQPVPPSTMRKGRFYRTRSSEASKQKVNQRNESLRRIWATSQTAIYVLVEIGGYLTSEVIDNSWNAFYDWAVQGEKSSLPISLSNLSVTDNTTSYETARLRPGTSDDVPLQYSGIQETENSSLDPEMLANAHKQYLRSLFHNLLLSSKPFLKSLRSLLTHVDRIIAFMSRLQIVWNSIDLQEEGVMETFGNRNYGDEAKEIQNELAAAADQLDHSVKQLLFNLKDLSEGSSALVHPTTSLRESRGEFRPYSGSRVDRLVFRLEYRMSEGDHEND